MRLLLVLTVVALIALIATEISDFIKTRKRRREINYINSVLSKRDESSSPLLVENIKQITRDMMDISGGRIKLPYQKDFVIDNSESTERSGFTYFVQTAVKMCFGNEYVCTITTSKFNKNVLRVTIKKELVI